MDGWKHIILCKKGFSKRGLWNKINGHIFHSFLKRLIFIGHYVVCESNEPFLYCLRKPIVNLLLFIFYGFGDVSLSEGAGFWHMEASFHVGDFKLSVRDWFVNEKHEHSVMIARYHYAEELEYMALRGLSLWFLGRPTGRDKKLCQIRIGYFILCIENWSRLAQLIHNNDGIKMLRFVKQI